MSYESFRGTIPADLLYDCEYDMWVRPEDDGSVTIGATAYGLYLAGKIIGFTSKPAGARIEVGRGMATVECAKTVIAVHAPLGFDLIKGNDTAEENPELLNLDPYVAGWMVHGRPHDFATEMSRLVDGKHYRRYIRRADPEAEFL
jgi:glycine cleavage system H protein